MNSSNGSQQRRRWGNKFRDAFHGIVLGVRGQSSFYVHFAIGLAVVVAGWAFDVTRWEWCVLLGCITTVLTAEIFNSAFESMGKVIDTQHNPRLENALDISSGAVLMASLGAAAVGTIVLAYRAGTYFHWWPHE